MARWKLACGHYINTVKPTTWEYEENDRETGERRRREFTVPRLLDPNDPKCWTNRWGNKDNPEGEVIVCQPGKGQPGDIEFLGEPTPDMIPHDEEAEAISAGFAEHWAYKPDVVTDGHFTQSMIDRSHPAQSDPAIGEGMTAIAQALAQQTELISHFSHLLKPQASRV